MRRPIIILILLAGLVGWRIVEHIRESKGTGGWGGGPKAAQVLATPAEVRTLNETVEVTGSTAPVFQATLAAKVAGRVATVHVQIGDRVSKGALVLTLDDGEWAAAEAQARAALANAEARLVQSRARTPITNAGVSAAIKSAKALRDHTKVSLDRAKSLFDQGYVPQASLDMAEREYAVADAQYRQALADAGQRTVQAEEVAALTAAVQQAAATLQYAQEQRRLTRLTAPFDGVITARKVDPGAMATAGMPLVTIMDTSHLWVDVMVPERFLSQIHPGAVVNLSLDAEQGKPRTGVVTLINPAADPGSLAFQVRIRLDNPGGALKPGLFARVEFVTASHQKATAVPKDAILTVNGTPHVFTLQTKPGPDAQSPVQIAHLQEVTTGLTANGFTEITNGVKPGDQVLILWPPTLNDGDPVKIDAPGPASTPPGAR